MGCEIAIVKYLVFIFNLVFSIIGLALLVVGVLFQLDIKELTKSFDASIGLAPTFLIVVGALIFVISFFGCCGAIKESNCMLVTYAVFLVVVLIIQVAVGVFSFLAIKDTINIKRDVNEDIQNLFNKYNQTIEDKNAFDGIQQLMKCCGVEGPIDWKNTNLPSSCCAEKPPICKTNDPTLYTAGCTAKSYEKIMLVVRSVGYVAFAICTAEIIGIFFAFCLTNSMRNQYRRGAYA